MIKNLKRNKILVASHRSHGLSRISDRCRTPRHLPKSRNRGEPSCDSIPGPDHCFGFDHDVNIWSSESTKMIS